jgi:hypothetical protein
MKKNSLEPTYDEIILHLLEQKYIKSEIQRVKCGSYISVI